MTTMLRLLLITLLAACGSSSGEAEVAEPQPLAAGGESDLSVARAALEARLGAPARVLGETSRLADGETVVAFTVGLDVVCQLEDPAPPTEYCATAAGTVIEAGGNLALSCPILGAASIHEGAVDAMLFFTPTTVCASDVTASFSAQDIDLDEADEILLDAEIEQVGVIDGQLVTKTRSTWRHVVTYGPELQASVQINRTTLVPGVSDSETPRSWQGTLEVRDVNDDGRPDLVLSRQLFRFPCMPDDLEAGEESCPVETDAEWYLYDHTEDHYVERPAAP